MRVALAALAITLAPGIAGAQPLNWRCDRQAFTTHCYGPDPNGGTWQSHTQHNQDGSTSTEIVPPFPHHRPRNRWGDG